MRVFFPDQEQKIPGNPKIIAVLSIPAQEEFNQRILRGVASADW
jgi:hypothetical protein